MFNFEDDCPICLGRNCDNGPTGIAEFMPNRVVPCCTKLFHTECIIKWVIEYVSQLFIIHFVFVCAKVQEVFTQYFSSEICLFRNYNCPLCREEIKYDELFPVAAVEIRDEGGDEVDVSKTRCILARLFFLYSIESESILCNLTG